MKKGIEDELAPHRAGFVGGKTCKAKANVAKVWKSWEMRNLLQFSGKQVSKATSLVLVEDTFH